MYESHTSKRQQALTNQLIVGRQPDWWPTPLSSFWNIIVTFTRLILLHSCGGQLFIYSSDCATQSIIYCCLLASIPAVTLTERSGEERLGWENWSWPRGRYKPTRPWRKSASAICDVQPVSCRWRHLTCGYGDELYPVDWSSPLSARGCISNLQSALEHVITERGPRASPCHSGASAGLVCLGRRCQQINSTRAIAWCVNYGECVRDGSVVTEPFQRAGSVKWTTWRLFFSL